MDFLKIFSTVPLCCIFMYKKFEADLSSGFHKLELRICFFVACFAIDPCIHHKSHVIHVFNVAKMSISCFIIFTVCSELLEPISTMYCHFKNI